MDKQEAIKSLKNLKRDLGVSDRDIWYDSAIDDAIAVIQEIKEHEKPSVPQFVADWYEDNKNNFEFMVYKLCLKFHEMDLPEDLTAWFTNNNNNPIQTLVKMKLYDYEVKEEIKLYQVEVPSNIKGCYYALTRDKDGTIILKKYDNTMWKALKSTQLTEDEIKENYDWTWHLREEVK